MCIENSSAKQHGVWHRILACERAFLEFCIWSQRGLGPSIAGLILTEPYQLGPAKRFPLRQILLSKDIWLSVWFMMIFTSRVKVDLLKRKEKNPSIQRKQKLSVESAFCSWVALLWNVMGNVTGLMIRRTPRAKCNYMLARATIKKEAAVNNYSSQTIMQFHCSCRMGPERKVWQYRHKGGGLNLLRARL